MKTDVLAYHFAIADSIRTSLVGMKPRECFRLPTQIMPFAIGTIDIVVRGYFSLPLASESDLTLWD